MIWLDVTLLMHSSLHPPAHRSLYEIFTPLCKLIQLRISSSPCTVTLLIFALLHRDTGLHSSLKPSLISQERQPSPQANSTFTQTFHANTVTRTFHANLSRELHHFARPRLLRGNLEIAANSFHVQDCRELISRKRAAIWPNNMYV